MSQASGSRANVLAGRTNQTRPQSSRWRRLRNAWKSLQVGRQGSYSIERLESLDHYIKTTSRTRVLLVCVLTPLPSLLVIIVLECLPLRPPSEGWAANWMFWIRLACTIFTMTFAGVTKLATFVPTFNAPLSKRLIVAFGASAAYVATALVAADVVVFPIPMLWILGGSFMSIYVPVMSLLVFGYAPFAKTSPCRQSLQRFLRYFFSYMTLAGVFPFYKVLYEFVPEKYRGAVIVVLPLWRLAAKQFMVKATRELEDFMPEIVAFTVDYFSALFVSVCMSTPGSFELAVLFIAGDVGQSLVELYDVREVSRSIKKLLRQDSSHTLELSRANGDDLVSMLVNLAREATDSTRLWACLPHPISAPHHGRLFRKASIVPASNYQAALTGPTSAETSNARGKAVENKSRKSKRATSAERSKKSSSKGCGLFFIGNMLLLLSGYGSFKADSAMSILLFGVLEVGSFLILSCFLLRKFSFSPLYQLAFVLETQMCSIQTKLFIETVLLLQYELAHLGTDFSFRFEWLQGKR